MEPNSVSAPVLRCAVGRDARPRGVYEVFELFEAVRRVILLAIEGSSADMAL